MSNANDRRGSRIMANCPLRHAVTVVVAVYNAAAEVRALVESLELSAPVPIDGLRFEFVDDGSTDPALLDVWQLPFFARDDVHLRHNERNLGFVVSVNRAIKDAPLLSDIVILNSDTRVFGNLFERLQEEAYSTPRIASVTPLTNNGTIASLFGFPDGRDLPPSLSAESIADVIHSLDLPSPKVWAPTGVGFCLYLRRDAIASLGVFDPIYGMGYGEESDWCQKAQAHGWRNLISTRSFVYHAGTKSFDPAKKASAITANTKLVLSRYPDYLDAVSAYCARNPLKFHRVRILLEILKEQSAGEMLLLALHADPNAYGAGTEKHVRQLRKVAAERRKGTVEIFPQGRNFRLRGSYRGHRYFDETFDQSVAESLFALLSRSADVLHANHFQGWSEHAIERLLAAPFRKKILTLHDLRFLCPSNNLLSGAAADRFCEVEADLDVCNDCLKNVVRYHDDSIQGYRNKSLSRLDAFDRVVVPSRAMLPYFKRALPAARSDLVESFEVLEHDLSPVIAMSMRIAPRVAREPRMAIAFVGAFRKLKGSELITASVARLRAAGFDVAVVGQLHPEASATTARLPVIHYETLVGLAKWLDQNRPMIVAHPSLTAESFCFTFFECLLLSSTSIPVVGRFGNPAELIGETGAGVVMQEMSVDGLVSACERARADYVRFAAQRGEYCERLRASSRNFADDYFRLIDQIPTARPLTQAKTSDLSELEEAEFAARRARHFGRREPQLARRVVERFRSLMKPFEPRGRLDKREVFR
jgi:GT2 family glycosyltransferase